MAEEKSTTPSWMEKLGGVKATYALGVGLVGCGTLLPGIVTGNNVLTIVGGVLVAFGYGCLGFYRAWTETTALKSDTVETVKNITNTTADKNVAKEVLTPTQPETKVGGTD